MLDLLRWLVFRRFFLRFKVFGFHSSIFSYSDSESTYQGFNKLSFGSVVKKASIGRFTYIAGARVQSAYVGAFCSIGPRARVGGLGRHPTKWVSTHPVFYSKLKQANVTFSSKNYFDECCSVYVENDVWVGADAIILDGIRVGNGAVVAAGAVVTRDVKPYSVVGGVPAKHIKYRFNTEAVKDLMDICWWSWPDDVLEKNANLIRSEPTPEVINKLKQIGSEQRNHA